MSQSTEQHIAEIRSQLIVATKVQLHTGNPMYEDPNYFGVYRQEGGKPLGQVGADFEPADLHLIVDTLIDSAEHCGSGIFIDLDTLKYTEHKGGKLVTISIQGKRLELDTPMVGDIVETEYHFVTGFDGYTRAVISFLSNRLWCANGARNWQADTAFAYKNTKGNQGKSAMLFCDAIREVQASVTEYGQFLNTAAKKKFTQAQKDAFFTKLIGYSQAEYTDLKKQQRDRLDAINAAVAIEEENTKANLFSLLQGVTRYTTHDLAGGSIDKVMVDTPMEMNRKAHRLIADMIMAN